MRVGSGRDERLPLPEGVPPAGGDAKAALALMPITKPVFARYRELVARDYPHLAP